MYDLGNVFKVTIKQKIYEMEEERSLTTLLFIGTIFFIVHYFTTKFNTEIE